MPSDGRIFDGVGPVCTSHPVVGVTRRVWRSFVLGVVLVGVTCCGGGSEPATGNPRAGAPDAGVSGPMDGDEVGKPEPEADAVAGGGAAGATGGGAAAGPSSGAGGGPGSSGGVAGAGGSDSDSPVPGVPVGCSGSPAARAPLRRLSRFEYDNTVADLLGDATKPAHAFPPELAPFGNDADAQVMSALQAESYLSVGEEVAARAMPGLLRRFACMTEVTPDTEADCASSIIETLAAEAFRRPPESDELEELLVLQTALRADGTFEQSIESLVSALLQGPDFLYRLEFGEQDEACPALRRPTDWEMATRLSYLYWGTQPDAELAAAARSGALRGRDVVRAEAERLLGDDRARRVVRYFFERHLPLLDLSNLARDPEVYPTFTQEIAALMREETLGFLEREIFEQDQSFRHILSAPSVTINDALGAFYGIEGASDSTFVSVPTDFATSHRRGLLTQGANLMGTTYGNSTNPVARSMFVHTRVLCQEVPPDPGLIPSALPPEAVDGPTTRDRLEALTHSEPACTTCHELIDPIGFAFENYDAVGLWRDQENGVTIDASGEHALLGTFSGPEELIARIIEYPGTYECLARWLAEFSYGRELRDPEAEPLLEQLVAPFEDADYRVSALLIALAQTDDFLYLPTEESP